MNFFDEYKELAPIFWTLCCEENEETEIPLGEGYVELIDIESEPRLVFLRLFNSLITFSHSEEDPYIRGYADIRYYGLKKVVTYEKGENTILEIVGHAAQNIQTKLRYQKM